MKMVEEKSKVLKTMCQRISFATSRMELLKGRELVLYVLLGKLCSIFLIHFLLFADLKNQIRNV